MTQAEEFDRTVRELHRLPHQDWWIQAGVEAAIWEPSIMSLTKWKPTQLQFKDGSYYNVEPPDQGPRVDSEDA